jgi:hypothetical protein
MGSRQHLAVVREDQWIFHLGRSFGGDIGVGILDGNQLHVRHGDEVAKVSGVINRMPVAHLDSGNANGHSYPRRSRIFPIRALILASLDARREVERKAGTS